MFRHIFFIHIRSALGGYLKTLFVPPFFNIGMMSRQENRRNSHIVPDFGAGIMGIFKKSAVNALLLETNIIRKNALAHSRNSVCQHHCRQFAACENIVTDGNFLVHYLVDDTLVNALIVTADNEDIVHFRQFHNSLLVEDFSFDIYIVCGFEPNSSQTAL